VVLAALNADLAHPLFQQPVRTTEILPDQQAILCTRRRRTPGEQVRGCFICWQHLAWLRRSRSYEDDRAKFVGRVGTAANPVCWIAATNAALSRRLSNTDGSVLDPIVRSAAPSPCHRTNREHTDAISGVADTREAALACLRSTVTGTSLSCL